MCLRSLLLICFFYAMKRIQSVKDAATVIIYGSISSEYYWKPLASADELGNGGKWLIFVSGWQSNVVKRECCVQDHAFSRR